MDYTSITKDVLEDTLRHALETIEAYNKKIGELPRGSLVKKQVKGNVYYYLSYRESGRVVTEYLGKLNDEQLEEIKELIEKRRKYSEMVKSTRKQIDFLQKALKIKVK